MAGQTEKAQHPSGEKKPVAHQVTLTFDRKVTDAEVKQMQSQHNAIGAILAEGGDHDELHHHTIET